MATFHYREEAAKRGQALKWEAVAVLATLGSIGAVLIANKHVAAGLSLLGVSAILVAIDLLRAMRVKKAIGGWEIAIDNDSFKWSSTRPSLGPNIAAPISAIKSLVVTTYAWSETGNNKRYQLVFEDGTREELWGWDGAPIDQITECLKRNGVTLVHEYA